MKAVLISIQPKWVEKIVKGEKTIEVRKTKPNLKTPFKCYIYQTIGGGAKGDIIISSGLQCGKVIGEFTCDRIATFKPQTNGVIIEHFHDLHNTCLSVDQILTYLNGKTGYGWHISDLKIYDKLKELIEFCKPFNPNMDIHEFFKHIGGGFPAPDFKSKYDFCDKITRPPQSWCYVEVDLE